MGGALLLLALLPLEGWLRRWGGLHPRQWINFGENPLSHRSSQRRHMLLVNILGGVFLLLGFVGSRPVAEPYVTAGLLLTLAYFLLLLLLPLGGLRLWRPVTTDQLGASLRAEAPAYPYPSPKLSQPRAADRPS